MKKINFFFINILIPAFTFVWVTSILLFYLFHHPDYYYAIKFFQYYELFFFVILIGCLIYGVTRFVQKRNLVVVAKLNGLKLWLLSILLFSLLYFYQFYKSIHGIDLSINLFFSYLIPLIWVQIGVFFIVGLCFGMGDFTLSKFREFKPKIAGYYLISIATGIIFLTLILMLAGSFSLLTDFFLLPFLSLLLLFLNKRVIFFTKKTLLTPLNIKKTLSPLGGISAFLLFFWLSINFIGMLRPIPLGFDSLTLYVKIPSLIQDSGTLVEGNLPYNWSLFMSLGYLIFKQTEFVLALSFLGGGLSLVAFYKLLRNWLDLNTSLFCVLLFYSLPAVNFLNYGDMKIDMGLLFFLLCILMLLLDWWDLIAKNKDTKINQLHPTLILLGIFSGFALGIKLTALLAVFAILYIFSMQQFNFLGLVAAFLLSIFFIIFLQLDKMNGLRTAFLNIYYVQWVCFMVASMLIGYFLYMSRDRSIRLLKNCLIYLFFLGITFLPWPIKNYLETNETKLEILLYGQHNNPMLNFGLMEKKWKEKYGIKASEK